MESHIERLWDIRLFLRRPRPLGEFLSLCGRWLGGKFSLMRISSREVIQWWVGVVCAIVEGRLWITSWFIVVWLPSCEVVYSGCLGLSGFHQRRFLIYLVGSNVEDQIHIYVWCGLYWGNEIGILKKMWSAPHLNCKHSSLVLFMSGLLYRVLLILTLFTPS